MNAAPESPLVAAVRAIGERLAEVRESDPIYLSSLEKQQLLVQATGCLSQLEALRARTLAAADDVAFDTGCRSAAAWLAVETRTSYAEATHAERLGAALATRWPRIAEASRAGSVTWQQTAVLVRSLDALPDDLDPELVAKAEAHLVSEAGHFGPRPLARLARRVLEVVAPDVAEEEEARALADEERRARRLTRLTFHPRGDGSTDVHSRLPDHVASRLRAYLDSYTSPRRLESPTIPADGAVLPMPRRRGEAFCSLLEQLPAQGLPQHGGTATSVTVMIDLDTLRSGLGLAETSTGDTITATEARRLACMANILPVVLDGAGEVLDLGRARRLFSPAQRKAMAIRDRRCRAEGCDIPAAWYEAHHAAEPWSRGGRTDLADGVLMCSFHHHRAHDPRWTVSRLPNGDVRYARRT